MYKWWKHENMHVHMQALKQAPMHTLTPPTFLKGLADLDVTVRALEFVEKWADLELVCDALPELWHDGAVFRGAAHLEDTPLAPLRPLWCWPVHHPVALNVLRLLLHLVEDGVQISESDSLAAQNSCN